MALTKGINSYVSVAEADTYFEDRIDVSEWTAAELCMKEQALTTATMLLDNSRWAGYAAEETQPLAWPRVGDYFDPRLGRNIRFNKDATEVPDRVKRATYEMAYHLITNDGLLDQKATSTGNLDKIKVGEIELDYGEGGSTVVVVPTIPTLVRQLINPLLTHGGVRNWFRAN